MHGIGTLVHDDFGKIRIDIVLRDTSKVIEVLFGRVFAEIGTGNFIVAQVGHDFPDVVSPVVDYSETAAGKRAVSAALRFGCALKHEHARSVLTRRKGRAQCGVAAAKHNHIVSRLRHWTFLSS